MLPSRQGLLGLSLCLRYPFLDSPESLLARLYSHTPSKILTTTSHSLEMAQGVASRMLCYIQRLSIVDFGIGDTILLPYSP